MRDNGLTASSYASMGGIDPQLAEPVLKALAEAGIAAYCEAPGEAAPADDVPKESAESDAEAAETGSDSESAAVAEATAPAPAKADEAAPPRIPVGFEEIFVDAESEVRARGVIARSSEDAEWASLVEQFNAPRPRREILSPPL